MDTINNIILLIFIILAIYFDLTKRKIPNFITLPVILWGLLIYTIFQGFEGFKFSVIGFLLGLLIFIIPFIAGGMGGGDVKMMAAIGALMGWTFVLYTAVYAGLIGLIIVVIYLIYNKQLGVTLKRALGIILKPILFILTIRFKNQVFKRINDYFLNQDLVWEKHYIPYGVAIGMGSVLSYIYLR